MTHEPRLNYYAAAPASVQTLVAFAHSTSPSLTPRLLELVRLRVSQINGCALCIDMHAAALTRMGVEPRHVHTVAGWREAYRFFDGRERAALAWAEALNAIPTRSPTDEEFRALRENFTDKEIVELSCAVTAIRAFNMLNVGFRTPVPEQPIVVADQHRAA